MENEAEAGYEEFVDMGACSCKSSFNAQPKLLGVDSKLLGWLLWAWETMAHIKLGENVKTALIQCWGENKKFK